MRSRWVLTKEEQDKYTEALKKDLPMLRAKADISQVELCNIIGLSRQSFSAIESGRKKMTWTTYLSLIMFFDNNLETRETLRSLKCYPGELFRRINEGKDPSNMLFGTDELTSIIKQLDDQALHTIRTMILVEYARCKKVPGDIIVKSFDGVDFFNVGSEIETELALRNIQRKVSEKNGSM